MTRFHFALSHLPDADQLMVNLHGRIFDIIPHTHDSMEEARRNHPVLSQMPDAPARRTAIMPTCRKNTLTQMRRAG